MKRAVAALSLGILVLVSSGPLAYAGTLTDLNAQLASLNINATELGVSCNASTNQTVADASMVDLLRKTLVTDEVNPIADKISKDLQALAGAVKQQESDESLMLSACTPFKLNQVDINEVNDKLARISALSAVNPSEQMITAAAEGKLITTNSGGCDDRSPTWTMGAYVETLQADASWAQIPGVVADFLDSNCIASGNATTYSRWTIANIQPGTIYRFVLPYFSPAYKTANILMPDYFSQYAEQKQQINLDAQAATDSYTRIWDRALAKDIQNGLNVVSPLISVLDLRIKSQAEKYPGSASTYERIISQEPLTPVLPSDKGEALTAAATYLAAVSAFQANTPSQLLKLIPRPISIQCVRGAKSKKVTGIAPRCPTGFLLKK